MTAIASSTTFQDRKVALEKEHTTLIGQKNVPQDHANTGTAAF